MGETYLRVYNKNNWQYKKERFPSAVGRSSRALPPLSNNIGGDARVPEEDLRKSSSET
jgi:hypothetical protein